MTKTTVIHHSADYDGIFCREIAKKFLPDAELIGWDYADPKIPFPSEGDVYVLDLNQECFIDVPAHTERIIWIDHHKSAIDKLNPGIKGYRIDGVAACRLAWQWFNRMGDVNGVLNFPRKEHFSRQISGEPLAVCLAGLYDVWDKSDPRAELLQHGLRTRDLSEAGWGDRSYWDVMLTDAPDAKALVNDLLASGKYVQYAKNHENESIIKAQGFSVFFEGLRFLALNTARCNSFSFTAGLDANHDGCLGFNWQGNHWRVSLYHAPGKEHHDLSKIAVKFGGGGHRGACGFTASKLPWMPCS